MSEFEPRAYIPTITEVTAIRFSDPDEQIAFKDLEERARAVARWVTDNGGEVHIFGVDIISFTIVDEIYQLDVGDWLVSNRGRFEIVNNDDFTRLYTLKEE
jgi:hypothetical protein